MSGRRLGVSDARRAHQEIGWSGRTFELGHDPRDITGVGDITHDGNTPELGGGRCRAIPVQVDGRHGCTVGREAARARPPDPRPGARDPRERRPSCTPMPRSAPTQQQRTRGVAAACCRHADLGRVARNLPRSPPSPHSWVHASWRNP